MVTVKSKNPSNIKKEGKTEKQNKNLKPSILNTSESSDIDSEKKSSKRFFLKMRWATLIFVCLGFLFIAGLFLFSHAKNFIDSYSYGSLGSNNSNQKNNSKDSLTLRIVALEKSDKLLSDNLNTLEELEDYRQRSRVTMSNLLKRIVQLEKQQGDIRALIKADSAGEFSRQSVRALEDIKRRLKALEANKSISAIKSRVTLLETKQKGILLDSNENLQTTISRIQQSLIDIKKTRNSATQGTQILVISQLREAILGGRQFEAELRALRTVADNSKRLIKSMDAIAPYAKDGVLQESKLHDKFIALSESLATKGQKNEKIWFEVFADQISSLVRVRQIDNSSNPTTIAGGIDQIKRLLIQKNIEGATSILEKLLHKFDRTDIKLVTIWLDSAKAHLVARKVIADLFSYVVFLSRSDIKN